MSDGYKDQIVRHFAVNEHDYCLSVGGDGRILIEGMDAGAPPRARLRGHMVFGPDGKWRLDADARSHLDMHVGEGEAEMVEGYVEAHPPLEETPSEMPPLYFVGFDLQGMRRASARELMGGPQFTFCHYKGVTGTEMDMSVAENAYAAFMQMHACGVVNFVAGPDAWVDSILHRIQGPSVS